MEGEKVCAACGETKPHSEFYSDKRASDGKRSQCKTCFNAGVKKWREANPDARLEADRRWKESHPDRVRAYRETALERERETGSRTVRRRKHRHLHPDRARARDVVKRAVATGKLIRPDVCEECGGSGPVEAHHPDYSRPLDVQWLCKACHEKKGHGDG